MPSLYRLAPEVYGAGGYSGHGIATATALGKELAKVIVNGSEDAAALPFARPQKVPFRRSLPWILRHVATPMLHAMDRFY
jgi:glycine/D-amino acid oxidase-like deaminating enzyme